MTKLHFALCCVAIAITGCGSNIHVKKTEIDPSQNIWGNNSLNANTSLYERCLERQKGHPDADQFCESQARVAQGGRK